MGRDLFVTPLQRHTPVRAVPPAGLGPKTAPSWGTPLMGFIDSSPSPTRLPLRPLPDEPSLTLRSGTATSQTRSVLAVPPGSDGLLRSETGSEDPIPWQLAGLLHPAADRGVRPVSGFLESEDSPAQHPGGARLQKPSSQAVTLRSVPLPGSCLPSPRSPAFTGKHCPLVVDPIHRVATLNRISTPRPCSTEESVPGAQRFRHARVDAPMGFGSTRSCLPRVLRGRGQVPRRSPRGSEDPWRRSLGPRALGRQSFSALSGSEDRCNPLCPEAETTADRIRSQSEDCCAPLSPAPFGAGWSLARWPDPKIEPWPRRRMLPEGKPDDSTAAPKNRRHHRSRCTRKCLDSGQPPAPPEGGPDDLQDPPRGF